MWTLAGCTLFQENWLQRYELHGYFADMEKLLDEKQNCEGRKREKHRHTETKRQTEMRNTEINGLV